MASGGVTRKEGDSAVSGDWAGKAWLRTGEPPTGKLDFYGSIPVPLKHTCRQGLERTLASVYRETGRKLQAYFPMNEDGSSLLNSLYRTDGCGGLTNFPDMFVSAGFDASFHKEFLDGYAGQELFQACRPESIPEVFWRCGLPDPEGVFSVFAVAPMVFLVDFRRLQGLPAPRSWEDIVKPIYRDQIVFGGWRKPNDLAYSEYNAFLLLHIYKDYGAEGLQRLAHNVKQLLPNSQIPRVAGSHSDMGAGIYILPWFQAQICPHRAFTAVVWPEDGALALPLYFLRKRDAAEKMARLSSYFMEGEFPAYLADNWYPPLSEASIGKLPRDASFRWLGWDYLRRQDMGALYRLTSHTFWRAWQEKNEVAPGNGLRRVAGE